MHHEDNLKYFRKPFIKKFKTRRNFYIYDVNSNEILKIDKCLYEIIEDYGELNHHKILSKYSERYEISELKEKICILAKGNKNKYLSSNRPKITFGIESIKDIKNYLNENLEHLILEVTQNCNLRCSYCAFSGKYSYKRIHKNLDMPFEIAKKAIDFFDSKSKREERKPNIGFYGGEPLLKYNFIQQILNYLKQSKRFHKFRYSLTTNGTLLNKEIIKFLVENNIFITLSLDGPKNMHDRYRIFPNGRGTYDIIINNLKKIKDFSNEYFTNYISINSVLAPPFDFKKINNYFYQNQFLKLLRERYNFSNVIPMRRNSFVIMI